MKTRHNKNYLLLFALMLAFGATIWSCKDDEPSLEELRKDKLAFLADSLRISDSLKRINAAGVVNYAITVVNGSTSTMFNGSAGPGRTSATESALADAIVTISQFGKVQRDTTDASGMVIFNGFFRSAVNITIEKSGFTKVSYVAAVSILDTTPNSSISFVGNIIPLFETAGTNTASISGRATIQTNLTNKTRELVADGTTVSASIDATSPTFASRFLTTNVANIYAPFTNTKVLYVGEILQANYSTGIVGTVTGGNYTITVPSAIDGLPLSLQYSDVAADQTLFETSPFNTASTYRNVFPGVTYTATAIPAAGSVTVGFNAGSGATATEVIALPETVDRINVTNGGSGYSGTPLVEITGTGTGATATAVVTNGVVTAINLTSGGSGYTTPPSVNLISGTGATASASLLVNGTVTGVTITNSGAGYTSAPTVTFSAPGGTGTTATGTANIDAAGRVTSVTITNAGSGYTSDPIVTFSAAPAGGTTATGAGIYSGQSIGSVSIGSGGANYTYAPAVTFSAPQRANGVRATGNAVIDPSTRTVTSIIITNQGSGYTAPPTVTLNAGSGAVAQALLSGGPIISANITAQGSNYVAPPLVVITGDGFGATGTAVLAEGKVVGINITNGGSGYTPAATTITLVSGSGAQGFATIVNGAVTGVTVVNGGQNYTGAPVVTFTSAIGGGAAGTATVSNGQVTGVTITSGGSGYVEGNTPGTAEGFSTTKGTSIQTKTGLKYINDVYYGTGIRQAN
jgi:hypothetical protein